MSYSFETLPENRSEVRRYQLSRDDQPMCWSKVTNVWQTDPAFRDFFITILADAPFPAFFWETPPVTRYTVTSRFEFVVVNSRQLAGVPADCFAFASHFDSVPEGAPVTDFPNLGQDARLICPCPGEPLSAYSHIAEFSRTAKLEQQHELWKHVGKVLEQSLGPQPAWLSTSGLGVYWLHIRIDSRPKYYTFPPYRQE